MLNIWRQEATKKNYRKTDLLEKNLYFCKRFREEETAMIC